MNWKREINGYYEPVDTLIIDDNSSHMIVVQSLNKGYSYCVRYYINDFVELKETIKAKDMEEARSIAVDIVKMRIRSHILYWERIRNAFENEVSNLETVD